MPLKSFNTIQYSAMALCFLSITKKAQPQAVYTDIDPDLVVDIDGEIANVDMNNDGVFDFGFLNSMDTEFTFDSEPQSYLERIWAGPKNPNNAIAGSLNQFTLTYGGLSTYYYPFALLNGVLVNDSLSFQTAGYQRMTWKNTIWLSWLSIWDDIEGGLWYPEIIDYYLGIRFIDTTGCNHYGWIRCDVKDEGRTLVIKDYAFETKCDTAILSGDTIGDITSIAIENSNLLNTNIYSFNSDVFIQILDKSENYSFQILNLSGAKISSGILSGNKNIISMSDKPKGYYFVEIYKGQQKLATKKIFIN